MARLLLYLLVFLLCGTARISQGASVGKWVPLQADNGPPERSFPSIIAPAPAPIPTTQSAPIIAPVPAARSASMIRNAMRPDRVLRSAAELDADATFRLPNCIRCGRYFACEKNFEYHYQAIAYKPCTRVYYCTHHTCARFFKTKRMFKKHIAAHDKPNCICPHCSGVFVSADSLSGHVNDCFAAPGSKRRPRQTYPWVPPHLRC